MAAGKFSRIAYGGPRCDQDWRSVICFVKGKRSGNNEVPMLPMYDGGYMLDNTLLSLLGFLNV